MERLPLSHLAEGLRCFVCGPQNPHALGVRFELVGDRVEATWTASDVVEGWPGLLHGAAFGALHDEAAAWAMIALAAQTGFTRRMEVEYQRPIPVGARVTVTGRVLEVGPRAGAFRTEIRLADGSAASTARTTFAFLDEASIERVLGRALTPTLARWLRAPPEERREMLVRASREAAARPA
jgi:uncharacterized protein (TIGR00369 family)